MAETTGERWRQKRSFWTWGYEADEPDRATRVDAANRIARRLGHPVEVPAIPKLADIDVRTPRIRIPDTLQDWVNSDPEERLLHTYGGHPLELLAALRGRFDNPPDAVAHPRTDDELEATLNWCDSNGYAAIPYGGGTTVVWGIGAPEEMPAVTIDMDHFHRVLEIDTVSRAARIQAGVLGPDLEDHLRSHGLTLRHFPQSFPWSTVGGWVATRSGGHYATNHTHIDDFVEQVRALTPSGWWESRRLPGSGAGPSPDRMMLGSEGTLGIITDCWLRLQKRPKFRATAGVVFPSWESGAEATRQVVQAKLWPANLRLLDASEAQLSAGLDGTQSLLIIGFESADVPQGEFIRYAVDIARSAGGAIEDSAISIDDGTGKATGREGAVGAWRSAFIGVNAGVTNGLGLLSDTFETAVTWDRWPEFDHHVREQVGRALQETLGPSHTLSCRFTHVYPDGPAPYYSFSGPADLGGEINQWREIKQAANEALITAGGTITHHHAVGRLHRDSYLKQMPDLHLEALRAAKGTLDPNAILNPGVLFSG